jgi:ATP-binding cassette subfamily B protein
MIAVVVVLVFCQSLTDLYLPTLMANIVDVGVVKGNLDYILQMGLLMLSFAAIGILCSITASYFAAKVAGKFSKDIRERMFNHVEKFSLQEFDQVGTASLITRTTNDITKIQQILSIMLRVMVMAPLLCIGGIMMAVAQDRQLSLVLVVLLPLLSLVVFGIARKGMPLFKKIQEKTDQLNRVLRERLMGIRVIRAFNRSTYETQRFEKANRDLMQLSIHVNRLMGMMMPTMMLLMNLSTIAIIWFGSIRIDHGQLQVGSLMAFLQYAMQIMFALMMGSMMFVFIPRATASAERIDEVLQIQPTITDLSQSQAPEQQKGELSVSNVTFYYPGAEKPALSNLSFTARPGQVTAIIGGTGAGKSTLFHLITRFYDLEQGQICIDGVDIRKMAQRDLRTYFGLVPQKATLFAGTIAENIRYGKEDASEEEIRHALEIAQASEFIDEMKEGLQTEVAQGGNNFSGGQKQRLAIARALVRKPLIYLFDDSFSALDFRTDARLRNALQEEIKEATVLIVAQRVTTVMDADQIIVLDQGSIAGIGQHHELLENCEVYREIVASQLSEEEIA